MGIHRRYKSMGIHIMGMRHYKSMGIHRRYKSMGIFSDAQGQLTLLSVVGSG